MPSQASPLGHVKFIQTTKTLLAAQLQSALVVRAGSFVAADDQTNCRFWSNLRGFTAKTCRDIGPFSFQRWAKIYYAEFVICQCETPFRFLFVDIGFAILVSMEHSVTRGKQRVLILFWSLSDWCTKRKLKQMNFCGTIGSLVLWHFWKIWMLPPTANLSIAIRFISAIGSNFCLVSSAGCAVFYFRCCAYILEETVFSSRTEFE